jgi:hypothetical protein
MAPITRRGFIGTLSAIAIAAAMPRERQAAYKLHPTQARFFNAPADTKSVMYSGGRGGYDHSMDAYRYMTMGMR